MQKSHLDKRYNFALVAIRRMVADSAPQAEKVQALTALKVELEAMIREASRNSEVGKG